MRYLAALTAFRSTCSVDLYTTIRLWMA